MNKESRKRISEVTVKLSSCSSELQSICDDEDYARNRMPENLANSERYEASENCSDVLEDSISDIDDVITSLQELT